MPFTDIKTNLHNFARFYLAYRKRVLIDSRTINDFVIHREVRKMDESRFPSIDRPKIRLASLPPSNQEIALSTIDYDDLKRIGLRIVRKPAGNNRWFKKQHSVYLLMDVELIRYGVHMVLDEIPPKHKIQLDRTNRRVRLIGRNVNPVGVGRWVSTRETPQ